MSDVTAPPPDGRAALSAEEVLDRLRATTERRQLFGGYGPLVLAAVLVLAMILLAPSVAPERIVERPVESGDTDGGDAE